MLLEAMIASVVLAVAAVGIASLLLNAHEQQLTIAETNTATLLAKQLMEEIAAKPLGTYVQGPTLLPRSSFTTVCQYNGYSDYSGIHGTDIQTLSGISVTLPGNYARSVSIAINANLSPSNTNDVCIVTVTVTTPSGKSVSLSKWLTNVTWAL